MAQTYLDSLMSEREKVLYAARQHWFILARNIALEIFLILLFLAIIVATAIKFYDYGVIIVAIGFILILMPVATMTRDILNYTHGQYIVTNRRVIHLSGVLNKNVIDSSLEKVNDVKMVQSAAGRMFDYGDIEILTASELGANLFKRIEKPIKFKTAMINAKESLERGAAVPVREDIPALINQLDQLRQQGALTEEEFQQKKSALLAKL